MIRKSQREKQRISPNAAQYIEPANAARFLKKQPRHAPESTMIRKSQREKQRISSNAAQYIEPANAARFP